MITNQKGFLFAVVAPLIVLFIGIVISYLIGSKPTSLNFSIGFPIGIILGNVTILYWMRIGAFQYRNKIDT